MKMKALELRGALAGLAGRAPDSEVFFMAATLRPETMYGQTNCWVLPDGDYVAVQGPGSAVYVMCAPASSLNLLHHIIWLVRGSCSDAGRESRRWSQACAAQM